MFLSLLRQSYELVLLIFPLHISVVVGCSCLILFYEIFMSNRKPVSSHLLTTLKCSCVRLVPECQG